MGRLFPLLPLDAPPFAAGASASLILTVLAVTLGVAVVLAIDLAGAAATGSFRASMETLAGDNDLEVIASGGVPEAVVGTIAALPYSIRISPRIEDSAVISDTKQTIPLIGLDLVAEANSERSGVIFGSISSDGSATPRRDAMRHLPNSTAVSGLAQVWEERQATAFCFADQ